jgi:hypothetical protein
MQTVNVTAAATAARISEGFMIDQLFNVFRKMGLTGGRYPAGGNLSVQFEAHGVDKWFAYVFNHDGTILGCFILDEYDR